MKSSCESRHQRGSDCKSLGKYRVTQLIYGTESVSRLQLSFSPPPKCLVIYQVFAARDSATICGMHNANIYKRDILDSVVSVSVSAFVCDRFLRIHSRLACLIAMWGFERETCACWNNLIAALMRWIKLLILNFFFFSSTSSKCQRWAQLNCMPWSAYVVMTRWHHGDVACAMLRDPVFARRALRSDLLFNIYHRLRRIAAIMCLQNLRHPHQRRWQLIASLFSYCVTRHSVLLLWMRA